MTAIQKLLSAVGMLTQKVDAIEKAQSLNPKQETKKENENTTDENGDGEGSESGDGEGTEGEDEQNAEVTEALQAVQGLTQRVSSLETGFASYKADLDKTFSAKVDAAAQEKLASSAGTPLKSGASTKEDRGALSTQGLKGRALQVAILESERTGEATK